MLYGLFICMTLHARLACSYQCSVSINRAHRHVLGFGLALCSGTASGHCTGGLDETNRIGASACRVGISSLKLDDAVEQLDEEVDRVEND